MFGEGLSGLFTILVGMFLGTIGTLTMSPAVKAGASNLGALAAVCINYAAQTALLAAVGVFAMVDGALDAVGFTYMDLFISLCIVYFVYRLTDVLLSAKQHAASTIAAVNSVFVLTYMFFYGFNVPEVVILPRSVDAAKEYVGFSELVKTEAAHQADRAFAAKVSIPPNVFLVYTNEEEPRFLGHGFKCDGRLYSAMHLFVDVFATRDTVLITRPNEAGRSNKAIVAKVLLRTSPKLDFAELECDVAGAVLGLKNSTSSIIRNGNVTVYHRDSDGTYFQQSVAYEFPSAGDLLGRYQILTKSLTTAGDSGMIIVQSGKVVGVHLGAHKDKPFNIHLLACFLPNASKMYSRLTASDLTKVLRIESDLANTIPEELRQAAEEFQRRRDEEDREYLEEQQRIREEQRQEEEERRRAREGENVDDQGYRIPVKRYAEPRFKGPSWADMDEEKLEPALEGFSQAPRSGAVEMQSLELDTQTLFSSPQQASSSARLVPTQPTPSQVTSPGMSGETTAPAQKTLESLDSCVSRESRPSPSNRPVATNSMQSSMEQPLPTKQSPSSLEEMISLLEQRSNEGTSRNQKETAKRCLNLLRKLVTEKATSEKSQKLC